MSSSRFNRSLRLDCWAALTVFAIAGGEMSHASEPQRLTTDGTLKMSPVFIAEGDEVVFATHEQPNLVSIVRLRLSDGSRRREHPRSPVISSIRHSREMADSTRMPCRQTRRRWCWDPGHT